MDHHIFLEVTDSKPVPIIHSAVSQSNAPDPHGGRSRVVHAIGGVELEWLREHVAFCTGKHTSHHTESCIIQSDPTYLDVIVAGTPVYRAPSAKCN